MPFDHKATFFKSCIIRFLHTGCAKIKKKSGAKGVIEQTLFHLTRNLINSVVVSKNKFRQLNMKSQD
jgi:hypothetical protein